MNRQIVNVSVGALIYWFSANFTDFADWVALLLLLALILTSLLRKRFSWALSLIVTPVIITAIVTLILKTLISRGTGGPFLFLSWSFPLAFPLHSFPSGHTSRAFALATSLGAQLPKWQAGFYAMAMLIGFSRIYLGAHDLIEVLSGAILGIMVSLIYTSIKRTNLTDL